MGSGWLYWAGALGRSALGRGAAEWAAGDCVGQPSTLWVESAALPRRAHPGGSETALGCHFAVRNVGAV
jgi:hypothetical protein